MGVAGKVAKNPAMMQALADAKQKLVDSINAIMGTEGTARKQAIADARDMQDAFNKLFKDIATGGKEFEEDGRGGRRRRKPSSARPRPPRLNASRRLPPTLLPRRLECSIRFRPSAAWPTACRRCSAAALGGAMEMGAQSQEALQAIVDNTTDPIKKLDLAIQKLKATIGAFSINTSSSGDQGMLNMQRQLTGLQPSVKLVAKETAERTRAMHQTQEYNAHERAEQRNQQLEDRRQLGDDMGSMIAVGSARPVQIIINGVNDVRQAVDNFEKELRRRGHHVGIKRKLETTTNMI